MSDTILIFSFAMEVRSAFVNILHASEAHHILHAALLQTPYFYYSKVHVVGFRQYFKLERSSNCEINRRVSKSLRALLFHTSQISSPWIGLSESQRGLNFRDVICTRRYSSVFKTFLSTVRFLKYVGTAQGTADHVK